MAFTNPEKNIEQLEIPENSTVAVFGSGTGAHTFAASRALGNYGRVYAIDAREDLVKKLKNEARARHLTNIFVIVGNIEIPNGVPLQDQTVDTVIIPNTLFSADDRWEVLKEAYRITKQDGRILIIDWKDSYDHMGPPKKLIITERQATDFGLTAGFYFDRKIDAGDHHFGVILKKEKRATNYW
jgi:ubiquinone/menaquinone biosynthesis C-methylase UbiE